MNAADRVKIIGKIAGHKEAGGIAKPKGLFLASHPEAEQAMKKYKRVRLPYQPVKFYSPPFTIPLLPVDYGSSLDRKEKRPESLLKVSYRHGPHALTRIAERLRRK